VRKIYLKFIVLLLKVWKTQKNKKFLHLLLLLALLCAIIEALRKSATVFILKNNERGI
jgi:hypothetical protein